MANQFISGGATQNLTATSNSNGSMTLSGASVGAVLLVDKKFRPPTRDSDGIDAAVAKALAAGGVCGIDMEDADYTITRDHLLYPNIVYMGQPGKLQFAGNIPDANFTVVGGTRWLLAAGVVGLKFANTPVTKEAFLAATPGIAERACSGTGARDMTFVGGKRAVDTGEYLNMGVVWSTFYNLFGIGQTDPYSMSFVNFQHCVFGRLFTSEAGIRFGVALPNGSSASITEFGNNNLIPGNSEIIGEIYTFTANRKPRSIVFESFGPASGCTLNQMKNSGRLQGNRYGLSAPQDIAMSFTSGSPNITVSNAAQFDLLQLDMPVAFLADVAGFVKTTVYFVKSRDAQNQQVTLVEARYQATPINATATTTGTGKVSGYEAVALIARQGCGFLNSDYGMIDAEAFGNVCAFSHENTGGVIGYLSEVMTSATGTAIAPRNAFDDFAVPSVPSITVDESSLFGNPAYSPRGGGPYPYSGGSFTLDAGWNGREVRYTGTADITITVPNNLPKNFRMSITPTGATGVITFTGSSGGAVFSKNGLRTNGQYATASLRNIANRVYRLTGDLQV